MKKYGKIVCTAIAYAVLIILTFLCLFFFYVLIINATRSHAEMQKGFSALPGTHFLENLKNVANDGSFPMFAEFSTVCWYQSALQRFVLTSHR